jgi:predicted nucleic acid-binding Zn ribbon protein
MRPHAAPTEPTDTGRWSDRNAGEPARVCVTCTRNEYAIDGLTQALARLRRGATALREENAELRAELASLRESRAAG